MSSIPDLSALFTTFLTAHTSEQRRVAAARLEEVLCVGDGGAAAGRRQRMIEALLREMSVVEGRRAELASVCEALRAVAERKVEMPDGEGVAEAWGALLTPRQCQVVALVLAGRSNKEIAADLEVQPATVRDHLRAIYERLGVTSRFELMARAGK